VCGDWGRALLHGFVVPVFVAPPSAFAAIALLAVDGILISELGAAGRPSENAAAAGVVLALLNSALAATVVGVNVQALRSSPDDAGARAWAIGGGVALSIAVGSLAFSSVMLWRARHPQALPTPSRQVEVTPWASSQGGGLSLSGTW
jgi:hypothetical protein